MIWIMFESIFNAVFAEFKVDTRLRLMQRIGSLWMWIIQLGLQGAIIVGIAYVNTYACLYFDKIMAQMFMLRRTPDISSNRYGLMMILTCIIIFGAVGLPICIWIGRTMQQARENLRDSISERMGEQE